jgi:hypothetical protein
MWYLVTFFPNIVAGYLYFRRNRDYGWVRSFALGHLLPLYNYISYLSAWRAVGRILRGRTNWDKTPRVGDRTPTSPTSPAPPHRAFRGSRQRQSDPTAGRQDTKACERANWTQPQC